MPGPSHRYPTRSRLRQLGAQLLSIASLFAATPAVAEPVADDGRLSEAADPRADAARASPGRRFVGTSLFTLVNLVPQQDHPHFAQLNLGYRLTERDVISVEALTWRYHEPLGVPYGPSKGADSEAYPGHVTEAGAGVAYQRMLWRGLYASASVIPLWRQFVDSEGERAGNGFQLFVTLRIGWHIPLWHRFFFEPSVAMTTWPVSTGAPAEFAALDSRWPSYFLFEPGMHAGVRF